MIRNKKFLIGYKLFFALLAFSALVTEIVVTVERGTFNPTYFFSYFTVETNILVVLSLLLSAIAVAMNKATQFDGFRSAVTVYILIVGIGFSLLLSGLEGAVLTAVPWDNVVLHYIIPVAVFVDFLIDRPKCSLSFRKSLTWLFFPVVYVTYALDRGLLTDWYPYPFLNPANGGYGSVALIVSGLFILGLALIWGVCKMTGNSKR